MRLFGHRYRLQVEDFAFEDLDIRFEVDRNLKPSANRAEITIMNLNDHHRKQLQEVDKVFVSLEAGWADGIWQIFRGDLREVVSTRQGHTWETVITSGDGDKAITNSRVRVTLAPGASIEQAIKALVSAMGLVIDDTTVDLAAAAAFEATGASAFADGLALSGPAADALDDLLEGTALEWSIQGGEVRLVERGKALPGEVALIAPGRGLIGSPEPGTKGITKVNTLMLPGIEPGRQVRLESEQVAGDARVERVTDVGDTVGGDWLQRLELRELDT